MLKSILVLAGMNLTAIVMAQHVVTIKIDSLPPYHSPGSDIYITGSFNGWNPLDINYKFQKDTGNNYSIQLLLADGHYEYKVTRGGWDKVECGKDGSSIDNHSLNVEADATISLGIEEWSDRFPANTRASTASSNVHIVDTSFFIPQLKRTRKIWIYLPESYRESANSFPVLYMQDGQNVFDDATSFAGEWGVDEYFDAFDKNGKETIVVAIDNGGSKRMNEYNPYDMERFGKGEGKAYVDFLVNTLKPYIDKNFRTLSDKANTSIAGSSMGGLISLYAILKYPKVFGGAGIFSPSLWIAPDIFKEIKSKGGKVNSKIYFYAGKKEGDTMAEDVQKAYELMKKNSRSKMTIDISEDGKHDEPSWRREFPLFYDWLSK